MSLPLSEHLPLIASAPDGIQKLRGLILELAVRGKLVPHDPSEEPASVLLMQIKQERTQLEAEGVCKKSKATLVDECNWPFELPTGWKWCRFPDVANYKMGKTPPTKESMYWADGGIPWVSISDMDHGQRIVTTSRTVSNAACAKVFRSDPVPAGTLLMSFKLTVGKVSTLGIDAFHNEAIISIFPFKGVSQEFLSHFLPMIAQGGNSKSALMGDTLNSESLALLCIPLPPTAEQHRIVAKVDELMALCDRLESEQNNSAAAHRQLIETLLGTLTQSTDAADFETNWKRIAEHFDTLFTTEASIDALQKSILQLAIMGKLVEQDPNDESAHELLKKVAQERTKLAKRSASSASKSPKPAPETEQPFSIPSSWKWERLETIAVTSTGKTPSTSKAALYGGVIPFIGPGQITVTGEILPAEKLLSEAGKNETTLADTGDILMVCIGGSIGKTAIANMRTAFNQQINCAKPILVDSKYLYAVLTSEYFQTVLLTKATGSATPIINKSNWAEIPIPVPPITEQHRIVAKIDELFGLCKRLKAQLIELKESNGLLSSALIKGQLG